MSERPNPLQTVASKVGVAASVAAGVLASLVTLGVLTSAQGDALTLASAQLQDLVTATATAIAGITTTISGIIASFATAKAGREEVTPVSDPRNVAGEQLTPAA